MILAFVLGFAVMDQSMAEESYGETYLASVGATPEIPILTDTAIAPESTSAETATKSFSQSPSKSASYSPTQMLTESVSETPSKSPSEIPTSSPMKTPSMSPTESASELPLPTESLIPTESRTIEVTIDQETLDQMEAERQKTVVFVVCGSVIFVAVIFVLICIYYKNKLEEDQNPAYTKAILGDDSFEFSHIETL